MLPYVFGLDLLVPIMRQRGPLLFRGMNFYPTFAGKLVFLWFCRLALPMMLTIVLGLTFRVAGRVWQLLISWHFLRAHRLGIL